MQKKQRMSRAFLLNMLLVTIVSIILIGGLWTWQQYMTFRIETKALQEMMLDSYKDLLKTQVQKSVDYIDYSKSLTEERLRTSIQERIYEAHTTASHLYEKWKGQKSTEEIQAVIKESLRSMRFNQGRGYFFILNLDGRNQLLADRPEIEGKDMLKSSDENEAHVVREMIHLITLKGEGFYRYDWSRPGISTGTFPKIAFVKLFEPYNWVIGTGEYLNDFETGIKADVLSYLGTIKFGKDGYVFVSQWDGLSLTDPAKGKNMLGVTDVNGVKIVQELISLARTGGGFLQYVMPKLKDMRPEPKLSYVQGIKEWEWYVGAGIYIDDIEKAVEAKRAEMTIKIKNSLVQIMSVLLGIIVFACFFARRTSHNARDSFNLFTRFFEKGASESALIEPSAMKYEEFENLAHSANNMIKARMQAKLALSESEKKYRLIVENSNDLIIKLDRDKKIIFASTTYCVLFEKSLEEILNQAFLSMALEGDRAVAQNALSDLDIPPYNSYHEERALVKSGLRWFAWSSRAILSTDGQPIEYVAVGRDITEKKQAEEASKENQEWLQNILDSIQAGVIVIDPETHKILELNRAALEMIGAKKEEIINTVCHNHICPNNLDNCPVTDLGLSIDQSDRELLTIGGTRIPIMKTVNRAIINGKVYLIESFLDLREKKRLESMLLHSQKMEAIGTLAGGIAHDFNNILSAIIGYAELSQINTPSQTKVSDYLGKLLGACNRAKDLVQQILTFSRQTGHELRPVSVKSITEEVLKLLSASLPSSIEICDHIQSDSLVMGDPTQIHQILMNLCTNAGHAMQKNGGILTISLTNIELDSDFTSRYPELMPGLYLNLIVRDTGHGISPEVLDRIFDPFFTTKDKGEGTGLGLAVVHGIIKAYGGMISVSSEIEKGSSFMVFLPVLETGSESVETVEEKILPSGTGHILLVDDEPALVDIGKQMLETLGYHVVAMTNPEKALALFREQPGKFDLVITDMTMPHMTGDMFAQNLISSRPDIPIMLLTGFSSEITEKKAKEIGIKGFMMKPIIRSELAIMVRKVLDEAGKNFS